VIVAMAVLTTLVVPPVLRVLYARRGVVESEAAG
jgi:hypothetical protein